MPNQTVYEWEKSLKTAFQFEPDHLSLYQLTIEEGTAFNQMFKKGKLIPIDNGLASEMYSITEDLTQNNKCLHMRYLITLKRAEVVLII